MSDEQLKALEELEDLTKEELIVVIHYAVTYVNELKQKHGIPINNNSPLWGGK